MWKTGLIPKDFTSHLAITVLSAVAKIERRVLLMQQMEGRKQKARGEMEWRAGSFWI